MSCYAELIRSLHTSQVMDQMIRLYGNRDGQLVSQIARYTGLLARHEKYFHSERPVLLISAPGRSEIGGNHTDHNHGKVLAAAINLDTVAAVSARDDMIVNIHSDGYAPITLNLSELQKRDEETGTTAALVRGVAARMHELGLRIGGFDAAVTSNVASGSGLSSSAAFEVLIAAIFSWLYQENKLDSKMQAQIGQYAENVYFGKPSGLLDQMASATGGLVTIDFKNEEPKVTPLSYDFSSKGYALVVVSTGGSHADLTDAYAAIPEEMKQVAAQFGTDCLRKVRPEEFWRALPELRGKVTDRAILRAMHFFDENRRVDHEAAALREDNLPEFFRQIIASGRSSFMYLQNVYADPREQGLSLALAMAETLLGQLGAWRVHGGGFAGTTLNFVPTQWLQIFTESMNSVFGENACLVLDVRPVGAYKLEFPALSLEEEQT